MVRRRRLQDSVIMTGRVPAEDIPKCMDAGDVFAMPCRSRLFGLEAEAFGIVYLEAAACGLPVVVGASGGAPETLGQGLKGVALSAEADGYEGARDILQLLVQSIATQRQPVTPVAPPFRYASISHRLSRLLAGL
jgi:phosphatidylinositol alpha-1,6-mannosyltransferase